MKFEIDSKKKIIKITPEREEDLYIVYLLVDKGDIVRGWTVREYKPEGVKDGERIKIYLGIRVEALEYHKFRGSLRIRGTVVEIQENIEGVKGRRHTLEVQPGREIEIEKKGDLPIDGVLEILNISKTMLPRVLVISVDDEEAAIVFITSIGIEMLYTIQNTTSKKEGSSLFNEYFLEIKKRVEELRTKLKPDRIVIAGPGLIVDYISQFISGEKVHQSSGGVGGVYEFLRSGLYDELKKEMGIEVYEKTLRRLATKSDSVALGPFEVETAAAAGRVDSLLILDTYIKEQPEDAWRIIYMVHRSRGRVYVVNEDTEVGAWLKKVGGISALLRW
ncbi:MAG: mRNA surveillance protein Pelota [Pyrobaculum sp.]